MCRMSIQVGPGYSPGDGACLLDVPNKQLGPLLWFGCCNCAFSQGHENTSVHMVATRDKFLAVFEVVKGTRGICRTKWGKTGLSGFS